MERYGRGGLSLEERCDLLDERWSSIAAGEEQPPLTEAQRVDLQQRLLRHQRDPRAGASWNEGDARLRAGR